MPDVVPESILARKLKEWCAAVAGRTEGDFAELIGTSASNLSRAKHLASRADTAILARAADALDLDAEEAATLYLETGHPLPVVLHGGALPAGATDVQNSTYSPRIGV